jgi:hypothetical protein
LKVTHFKQQVGYALNDETKLSLLRSLIVVSCIENDMPYEVRVGFRPTSLLYVQKVQKDSNSGKTSTALQ